MKIDRDAKALSGVIAILCGMAYLVTYSQHPVSEVLWGFAVFFACLNWFTEKV